MFNSLGASIRRFVIWLGPGRSRFLFILLAATGLISLMLNAVQPPEPWVMPVQSLMAIGFLVGAVLTIVTRFDGPERRQILMLVGPAVAVVVIGLLAPPLMLLAILLALGWLVIASITLRSSIRQEYQRAIRHMRKGEYDEAITVMSELIHSEPERAEHHRFRAELYRLSGKVKKAQADYERVVALSPESGVGYNGLAEVHLQSGEYEEALPFARQALEREPHEWVAAYNLGMIEDRLGMAQATEHVKQALKTGIPDSRHRMLAHLWLARAALRGGDRVEAERRIEDLKREKAGLREWRIIFDNPEAAVLRDVLAEDVELAQKLAEGSATLEALSPDLTPADRSET